MNEYGVTYDAISSNLAGIDGVSWGVATVSTDQGWAFGKVSSIGHVVEGLNSPSGNVTVSYIRQTLLWISFRHRAQMYSMTLLTVDTKFESSNLEW